VSAPARLAVRAAGHRSSWRHTNGEPRVALMLGAAALIQAVGGAAVWAVVLHRDSSQQIATVGAVIAITQLAGLLGGAGLPVVVARVRAEPDRLTILQLTAAITITGASLALVLLSAVDPPRSIGRITLVAVGALASMAVVVDAHMAGQHQWNRLLARVTVSAFLRILAIGLVASGHHLALVLLAPDAATSAVALTSARNSPAIAADQERPELGRYAITQYASTLMVIGALLVTPVLCGRYLSNHVLATFYPAWTIMAVVATIAASAASAPLMTADADAPQRATRPGWVGPAISTSAAIAFTGVSVGGGALPHRAHDIATAAAGLLLANMLWPYLMRNMTLLRIQARNRATIAIATTWYLTALAPTVVMGTNLTIARLAIAWACASLLTTGAAHVAARATS